MSHWSQRSAIVLAVVLAATTVSAFVPGAAAQDDPLQSDRTSIAAEETGFAAMDFAVERWLLAVSVATRLRATVAQSQPAPARIVRSGPRSSAAVALTFDDGFNRDVCARIADTLRAHDAVGTFFVNGNHLKGAPREWRPILQGMQVGNHTRSHLLLTDESNRVIAKQIRENETLHEQILGRPMLKLLRPPYGASDQRVSHVASTLGYDQIMLWNVDTHDWKRSSSPRDIARSAIGARPGSVILMHCSRGATAKALPRIIRHYQARGIKLAGLDEVIGR